MNRQTLLKFFPPGSPEWAYYAALHDLFESLPQLPEPSAVTGIAIIAVLELTTFTLADGRVVGFDPDPRGVMGSIGDIAYFVAHLFPSISADPIWWKVSYPTALNDPEVRQAAERIRDLLASSPLVRRTQG